MRTFLQIFNGNNQSMKSLLNTCILFVTLLFISCAASKQYEPLPKNLDLINVPRDTINMIAEDYHFNPEVIRVNVGTLLRLNIISIEGIHGFRLSEFGIDERLEENTLKSIELYIPEKGEYTFRCSHFCGIGHFGMTGKIIVE